MKSANQKATKTQLSINTMWDIGTETNGKKKENRGFFEDIRKSLISGTMC